MKSFEERHNNARDIVSKEFGIKNPMQLPAITKVVINMGLGQNAGDSKAIQSAANELSLLAMQKSVITHAKKSIAGFKLREKQQIGCKVTLRDRNMRSFMDRLVILALPRVRDFRGLSSKSFDGQGNYSLGLKEHIVFPEIDYDKIDSVRGMDICIVTSTNDNKVSRRFLELLGLPFRQ